MKPVIPAETLAAGGHCDESLLVAELLPLVQIMLGVVARCQAALLQEQDETLHVIRGTLSQISTVSRPCTVDRGPLGGACPSAPDICRALGRCLHQILADPDQPRSQRALLGAAAVPVGETQASWRELAGYGEVADWFQRLSLDLRGTHPRAVEMLQLRMAGLGSREIAERLSLPYRLVRQVLRDVAARLRARDAAPEPSA